MKFINILQIVQLFVTFTATIYTPIDQCIYGFFAFVIGFTYALVNLMMSSGLLKYSESLQVNGKRSPKENIILIALKSIHDYVPIGFINMEIHHLSSQFSFLSFMFCIPFCLDILSCLFDDGITNIADEKVLMYMKMFNIIVHSMSIGSLARHEFNVWFMCIWLATLLIGAGVYYQLYYLNIGECMKLHGYILFYIFASIGIYDDDFLQYSEWFNVQ